MMVGLTWGSRVRDNPRLREVSPTGKFWGGRRGGWGQFAAESRHHRIDRSLVWSGPYCVVRCAITLNVLKTMCMISAALGRRGSHDDRAGPAQTTTLGLRDKPFAYPPPTSQRLLLSAPGCRLSGYPGSAIPKTT